MVRLLSLMILLLVPNPFTPRTETDPVPVAETVPAIAHPVRAGADRGQPIRLIEAGRVGMPNAVPGDPVPALPDSIPIVTDPREHPIV